MLPVLGWKIVGNLPEGTTKCVVIMAPHTSNIDFFYGWLGFSFLGLNSHFLIKKEAFGRISGPILRAMGGIPVDRAHSNNVVPQLAAEFEHRNNFILTITPEGTRKLNRHWKKGFYHIAHTAHVPVVMGFLDYKHKIGGLGPAFLPGGDINADLEKIRAFYHDKQARHPEKFSLPGFTVVESKGLGHSAQG